MTALTAAARRRVRNISGQSDHEIAVGTGATIWAGSLVSIVLTTERAVVSTAATGRKFLGLAIETKTGNTGGTVLCKVISNVEVLVNAAAALTGAYIGSNAFVDDDNQVTTGTDAGTALVSIRVGRVTELEGGDAWCALNQFSESDV